MALDMEFEQFKTSIKRKIGLDLNSYKEKQLKRRISQFMTKHKAANFTEFFKILDKDAELLDKFRDYLTINTSEFFRDKKVYDSIRDKVIPDLVKKTSQIKVWSAGCSIGAEPYSMAILMKEARVPRFKIDATDFDIRILSKAREGLYAANLLKNMDKETINKYFSASGDKYAINDSVKQNITFKRHNLLKDEFPTGYDLILCRNVFIYFTHEAQRILLSNFSKSLKDGGYYIIGTSEFISQPEQYRYHKESIAIYQKR